MVTGISPAYGPEAGGTFVTITGTDLLGATAVKFGTTAATDFTVDSGTQINATAPAGSGTADIIVTTPGGPSATGAADRFTWVAVPTFGSIAPAGGLVAGGEAVTITGTGFVGPATVTFGGTPAPATASSTLSSPVTGTATDIPLASVAGFTPGPDFAFIGTPAPEIIYYTSISGTTLQNVTRGAAGSTAAAWPSGTTVTQSAVTVASPTRITTTAPAHGAGAVNILIATAGGTATGTNAYTYTTVPVITVITPTGGPLAGTAPVNITGYRFTGATGVNFGPTAATSLYGKLILKNYRGGPGRCSGHGPYPGNRAGRFQHARQLLTGTTYSATPPPALSVIWPENGPQAGGTTVAIGGSDFTSATAVMFGTVPATSFTVEDSAGISAVAPAGTAGPVDITVTTPWGTSPVVAAGRYTYNPLPAVTGIAPATGPQAGGTVVTITGTGLADATAVNFGAIAGTDLTGTTATSVTATSPAAAMAGIVNVTVVTLNGTSIAVPADRFTYTAPPPVVTFTGAPSQTSVPGGGNGGDDSSGDPGGTGGNQQGGRNQYAPFQGVGTPVNVGGSTAVTGAMVYGTGNSGAIVTAIMSDSPGPGISPPPGCIVFSYLEISPARTGRSRAPRSRLRSRSPGLTNTTSPRRTLSCSTIPGDSGLPSRPLW